MRTFLLCGLLALAACGGDDPYDPEVTGLPAQVFAGGPVRVGLEPILPVSPSITVTVGGAGVEWHTEEGELVFAVPDTLNGPMEIVLTVEGHTAWSDTVDVLGLSGFEEADAIIGVNTGELLPTTDDAGTTFIWGDREDGRLGRLLPQNGVVTTYDTLLPLTSLRSPGPAVGAGEFILSPPAALAVDSLEVWTLGQGVGKVRRIPRFGAGRQLAQLSTHRWLRTNAHGVEVFDDSANAVVFNGLSTYEEPHVIYRAPNGKRTAFTFGGGNTVGTPVFGTGNDPVYHISGLRGVNGIAFPYDTGRMVLVGHDQGHDGVLIEVVLQGGARIDSIPLDYEPQGVTVDLAGRVYVLGADSAAHPFLDVFARPGYTKIGHLQAPASTTPCGYWCDRAVLAFHMLDQRVWVVEGMVPNGVGRTGNGIWSFRMPMGVPATALGPRTR